MVYIVLWLFIGLIGNQLLWSDYHSKLMFDSNKYYKEKLRKHDKWAYLRGFAITVGLGPISIGMYLKRSSASLFNKIFIILFCFSISWIFLSSKITVNDSVVYKGPFALEEK